jgi:pimeloyl-ACP methyl ester carboxylesterase
MKSIKTDVLEIAYEDEGPEDGLPVLLLHGWPDGPGGWTRVAGHLRANGWRTIIPCLRGLSPTRFLSDKTPRYGAGIALAQDAIELMTALRVDCFAVVGHDWGARAAYTLAALFPERLTAVVALALAYQPFARFQVPGFQQSKQFWYQWFQCIEGGAAAVRRDPIGFARIQWDTWSPPGWFSESEFIATAKGFKDPDWVAITLNAYRSRWIAGEITDRRYQDLQSKLEAVACLSVPTLMIQGASDFCDHPSESEGLDRYFSAEYQRVLLEGVGHFPHRESANAVASHIERHLRKHMSGSVSRVAGQSV